MPPPPYQADDRWLQKKRRCLAPYVPPFRLLGQGLGVTCLGSLWDLFFALLDQENSRERAREEAPGNRSQSRGQGPGHPRMSKFFPLPL